MIKNINLDSKHSVEVNSSAGWLLIYRSQFGHDILPDLMPALEAVLGLASSFLSEIGEINEKSISVGDMVKSLDKELLSDITFNLSTLEIVTIINVFWAMAKNADRDIPEPEVWVNQFDNFPFDVIAPAILDIVIKSCVSSKNLKRLKEMMKPTPFQSKNYSLAASAEA